MAYSVQSIHGDIPPSVLQVGWMIEVAGTAVTVDGTPWQGSPTATFDGYVIHGTIPGTEYSYVICKGDGQIVGVLYPPIHGGGGPGTWVADEEGSGGDGYGE